MMKWFMLFGVALIAVVGLLMAVPSSRELPLQAASSVVQVVHQINQQVDSQAVEEDAAIHPLVSAARQQIGVTRLYDPAYVGLDYPNGDVPAERGVCTDVVVRALRVAYGMDLQQLIHDDMRRNFSAYPNIWGLSRPDKNIDHRRVPNIQTYLKRQGDQLPLSDDPAAFEAGDIVTSLIPPQNLPHIMIVSSRRDRATGRPYVIHNIGLGTQETDTLFDYPLTGHYRIQK